MRITQNIMTDQVLQHLSRSMERLQKAQTTLSSGKRINKPSDDPVGITKALAYRATLSQYKQYIRNVHDGLSWLKHNSFVLEEVSEQLARAREIVGPMAVRGETSAFDEQARAGIAVEVDSILDQVLRLANTRLGGRYVFAGSETLTQPFEIAGIAVNYSGNSGELRREIRHGVTVDVNIVGSEVFQTTLETLIELKEAVQNDDQEAISGLLDDLDEAMDTVLSAGVGMGAKINRLEMMESRLQAARINTTELLSETEDADTTEAITDFMTRQNAYQVALAAAAKMIQPSLVDFLR